MSGSNATRPAGRPRGAARADSADQPRERAARWTRECPGATRPAPNGAPPRRRRCAAPISAVSENTLDNACWSVGRHNPRWRAGAEIHADAKVANRILATIAIRSVRHLIPRIDHHDAKPLETTDVSSHDVCTMRMGDRGHHRMQRRCRLASPTTACKDLRVR